MKCLIFTEPDDSHAYFVQLALEQAGHGVKLLFSADHPTKQKNTVLIDNESCHWKTTDGDGCSLIDDDYDVVWWRRARKPYLPKALVHPEDYDFLLRENHFFFEGLTQMIMPDAWWVNPKLSAAMANYKLYQLAVAKSCGLTIPLTLSSNSPHDIRSFLLEFEDDGVVYKPQCANHWHDEASIKAIYTTPIGFLDLPGNKQLQLAPGFYQQQIKKHYELRVVCFGHYLVAAKINSQAHEAGKMDWRKIPKDELDIEPYILPEDIANKIRDLMTKMGLVFGSLDLIVTPEGGLCFLEVNEQGQFLWLEDCNPAFKMLDTFVQFLLNQSDDFFWEPRKKVLSCQDYQEEVSRRVAYNINHHVHLNGIKMRLPKNDYEETEN